MTKALEYIFLFFIFPGLLFSASMGLMAGWVDRKITARLQWRVGPPWYQNFLDLAKLLFCKETLFPSGVSRPLFMMMPLVAVASATLISTVVLVINGSPATGFIGDVIVIVYLLMIPSISLMLGAFISANPLASLGASREMKLMLAYELPFILALIVPIVKAGYAIRLGDIITYQYAHGFIIGSLSGIISFIVMILCIQAKLGFIPFDIAEAETEIISGPYIEYSGKTLGMLKLSKSILTFAVPMLLIALYFGGLRQDAEGIIKNILQFILILGIMIVIKNTNPRVRIDHAVAFFWGPVTALAVISIILASLGY